VQIIAILMGIGEVARWRIVSALKTSGRERVGANTLQLVGALPWHVNENGGRWTLLRVHVATAQVLSKVFLARESVAGAAVAIGIGTHQGLLSIVILLVDLALVAQESTRVGKALNLVATWFVALVRAIVFIHVFTDNDESV
jgi:hypothetical protein